MLEIAEHFGQREGGAPQTSLPSQEPGDFSTGKPVSVVGDGESHHLSRVLSVHVVIVMDPIFSFALTQQTEGDRTPI